MLRRKKAKNKCGYWDCSERLPDNQFLCAEHYRDWEQGTLDRCPECGRFKDVTYHLCQDCYFGRPVVPWESPVALPQPKHHYRVEYSEAWTDGYMLPERVFVYLLQLADGTFYVGHTRDIRKEFTEHRNAKVGATAGLNPRLRYLELSANLRAAELREAELKRLVASNPYQIEVMMSKFQEHMLEFGVE